MECLRTDEILRNPDLAKYLITFSSGQTIFLEGDDSQDLYILVAGQVEIFRGAKKIRDISEKGSVFGELSFFLGDKRTASVKAKTEVEVIRIPQEKIMLFLEECPTAGPEIIRHLSQWLSETTQMLYGLKEVSDQLDNYRKVLTPSRKRYLSIYVPQKCMARYTMNNNMLAIIGLVPSWRYLVK